MKSSLLTLRVKRFQKEKDPPQWMQIFQVEIRNGMNLLEALLRIQDEQDGMLAFRYSCRGAVCGSCAMKVNGKIVLACRTHVEDFLGKPPFIEPLPYFPVIRDLIVDMSTFFINHKKLETYLHGDPVSNRREYLMNEDERNEINPYIQCILCGICFGTCPAFKKDSQFLGPAVLAKAYRFLIDPRDKRKDEILKAVDGQKGVWGCKTVFNCTKVCPKEVPPTHAIVKMRRKMVRYSLASIISQVLSLSQQID